MGEEEEIIFPGLIAANSLPFSVPDIVLNLPCRCNAEFADGKVHFFSHCSRGHIPSFLTTLANSLCCCKLIELQIHGENEQVYHTSMACNEKILVLHLRGELSKCIAMFEVDKWFGP